MSPSKFAMNLMRRYKLLPVISKTERQALEAGDVWIDGDIFRRGGDCASATCSSSPTASSPPKSRAPRWTLPGAVCHGRSVAGL